MHVGIVAAAAEDIPGADVAVRFEIDVGPQVDGERSASVIAHKHLVNTEVSVPPAWAPCGNVLAVRDDPGRADKTKIDCWARGDERPLGLVEDGADFNGNRN